jgi:hypothetical protein
LIALLTIVALGLAAGVTVLVVTFLSASPDGSTGVAPTAVPSTTPPIELDLADRGATVTLTWTDPTSGKVSFVVAYGRADGPADRNQRLPAGTTTVAINGLNPRVDYCFTVSGIESTTTVALSHVVCTRRSASAGPSGATTPTRTPPSGSASPSRG